MNLIVSHKVAVTQKLNSRYFGILIFEYDLIFLPQFQCSHLNHIQRCLLILLQNTALTQSKVFCPRLRIVSTFA